MATQGFNYGDLVFFLIMIAWIVCFTTDRKTGD